MQTNPLSKNGKLVLYGLVKYPSLPDYEICKKIGLKKSTFSIIKKKLKENRYYTTIRTPILQHIGCELLVVSYVQLNRKTKIEERLTITREMLDRLLESFYNVSESNQAVTISISKNITDFLKSFAPIIQIYDEHDFFDREGFIHVFFPFELTTIFNFFIFSPLLDRLFGLGLEKTQEKIDVYSEKVKCRVKYRDMSDLEKKVYYGLVKYPDLPDYKFAEQLSTTRSTVMKMKERFYAEKLMRTTRMVNMKKLGLEILALTHSKFNPKKPIHTRGEGIKNIIQMQTPFFNISSDLENVMLTAYKNFEDYHKIHERVTRYYVQNDVLREEPKTLLLSIPSMTIIKHHMYVPLVKKILEVHI